MRNLKRALSLALASVMLLGMMVVGTSAAFTDSDQVVNTEAVEITAGLGLFAGNPDGSFNPKGTVTRAQMATVIAKMLYGSDVDAEAFKGSGKFSDVANFEGGWADGYVNICAGNNIISGYPDGTFKPGQAVTTAEASVMIIKALKVEVPTGEWPTNVMIKADEMELFEELAVKPGANTALNRDQLASIVWEGMNYSADGVQGYKVMECDIVFKSWSDAAAYANAAYGEGDWPASYVTEVKGDTLAETVFEIESATGYITANQATGEDYTVVAGKNVNLETGLDMLGHFVTVYFKDTYKNEKNPGTAYCVVEAAEYVKVSETITADKKDFLAAFGAKVEDVTAPILFDNKGYMDGETGYSAPAYNYDENGFSANAGTYVIDNESGKIIAYIAPIASAVETVARVTTTPGKESIRLSNKVYQNNADEDVIVEYDGIAEDDIVVVKNYRDTMTYVFKPEVVSGKVTKTGKVDDKAATYIDGTAYVNSTISGASAAGLEFYAPDANKTYDAYLYNGKLIGMVLTAGAANLSDAIFVVDNYVTTSNGNYGGDTEYYYAQGIDANGKEVSVLIGVEGCSENMVDCGECAECTDENDETLCEEKIPDVVTTLTTGKFYTFEKVTADKEQAKKGVMKATPAETKATYDEKDDEFFAEAVTGTHQTANQLKKDDKYVKFGSTDRAYLTANTKFVVVKANTTTDALEIVTYTGAIAKDISGDALTVAASKADDGNYYAEMIVIVGALALKSEDYIYISAAASADAGLVEGGKEVVAYFSETKEYKTIVADDVTPGFYTSYTIDEDGVYELSGKAANNESTYNVKLAEEAKGVISGAINSSDMDLYNAAEAVVVDVRSADVLEDSDVAAIESLSDIAYALKSEYKVYFDAIVDNTDKVVTHIFVYSVKVEKTNCIGEDTGSWIEDGTAYSTIHDGTTSLVKGEEGTHAVKCDDCEKVIDTEDCTYVDGSCACGAEEPASEPAPEA